MGLIDRLWHRLRHGFAEAGRPAARPATQAAARIIGLSMVKNEQDIIEPFIRHNARFLDAMVLIDNGSVDDTRRIIVDCAREIGTVIVSDSKIFAYTQAAQMTRLLQYCQTAFFADFIVFLDADEFISAPDAAGFRAALAAIPPHGAGLMPWRTHILSPLQAANQSEDPPRTMRWRRVIETPLFRKAVLRLDGRYRDDLLLWQGNHHIATNTGDTLPAVDLDNLPLLHFPVRSRAQLCAKAVAGWMAYLAKDSGARRGHEGAHWRDIFDMFINQPVPPDDSDMAAMSLRYAQERPLIDWHNDVVAGAAPGDYVRRYSTGAPQEPLSLIARSWEASLTGVTALLQLTRPPLPALSSSASATAFDAVWHWDHLFVDVPPCRFISDKYAPKHVLDIGCGIGAYLTLFKNLGATSITGVDGVPAEATALADNEYIFHDLSQPLDLGRVFDLVICTEVAEHVDRDGADILLDNIMRHAGNLILFSAAEPGQPGHGHINCQPIGYWLEKFAARGWYPDLIDSFGIRSIATLSWLRRNLVVLRCCGQPAGRHAIDALTAIGALPFAWYSQEPGIREYPFAEPLPAQPLGYRVGSA
jgi:SAM-dependent methyltransferase